MPWFCGLRRIARGHRGLFVVAIFLGSSLAVNVALMVRYKIPRRLWEPPIEELVLPHIELSRGASRDQSPPLLAAPSSVRSVQELRDWQARGRQKLQELLKIELPTQLVPVREVGRELMGTVVRRTLVFTQHDGLEVPAFLLHATEDRPRPGILVIPGHSMGIVATSGIVQDYQNAMALRLAEAGYVVLTMEVRGFGYLQKLGDGPNAMDHGPYTGYCLVRGRTRLGLTISDALAGLNYLEAQDEVDADRLGVVGFSSGCDATIYLAAMDQRVNAVVASGCVCSHESNFQFSRNDSYEAVPGLAQWLEMSDCLGLLSPRPVLVHWGADDNDPKSRSAAFNPTSLRMFEAAKKIYAAENQSDQIEQSVTPGLGHAFDVEAAVTFVKHRLPVSVAGSFVADQSRSP